MRTIDLDHNATTKPTPEVVGAVAEALTELWHNPSSVHRPGQRARHAVEMARAKVAALLGASPRRITFTGTGTESIALAIRGTLGATNKRTIITTPIEHAAIRDLCEQLGAGDVSIKQLPILPGGIADADALDRLIDDDTALVSVQWANNETGAIQPVDAVGETCSARGVPFHCDATQWIGKMPCDLGDPDAPKIGLLSCSPHKFHGPKGVGVLWTAPGVRIRPTTPGSQELGRRGGTENLPAIAGAGVAAEQALAWLQDDAARVRLGAMRDAFERSVLESCRSAVVNKPPAPESRLWNTTSIAFPNLEAEALLMGFSERGLCASAGAACSSGSLDPSPVLLAMGIPPELAHGSVRFSMSRETTQSDLNDALPIIAETVARLSQTLPR